MIDVVKIFIEIVDNIPELIDQEQLDILIMQIIKADGNLKHNVNNYYVSHHNSFNCNYTSANQLN